MNRGILHSEEELLKIQNYSVNYILIRSPGVLLPWLAPLPPRWVAKLSLDQIHGMEAPLKELAKLEKLTEKTSAKSKSPSISDSLDSLLQSLRDTKERLEAGTDTQDTFTQLASTVEQRKKEVDDRQKEIYSSLSRFGKALDKVSTHQCDSFLEIHKSDFVLEIH